MAAFPSRDTGAAKPGDAFRRWSSRRTGRSGTRCAWLRPLTQLVDGTSVPPFTYAELAGAVRLFGPPVQRRV